jgi:DNA-binding CsgD family transcriptional regulator
MVNGEAFEISLALAARELGHNGFHQRLLDLAGTIVDHDSGWIVRYDAQSAPDVMYTKAIPTNIVEYYLEAEPHIGDPYFCSWRGNLSARIETLADALPMAVNRNFYDREFKLRAHFSDELALYLPSFGTSCLALFFELRDGRFGATELARLKALFPAVLGLHDAHLRMVLSDITSECAQGRDNAFTVLDKTGTPIFSTVGWRIAEQSMPTLRMAASCKFSSGCDRCDHGDVSVRSVALDEHNAIAPGGCLIYLADGSEKNSLRDEQRAIETLEQLTPRERDILWLTLEGHSTGAIAQQLALSKGYIKNCRQRMYKKFNVSSERKLISLLGPLVKPLISQNRVSGGAP